VSSRGLRVTCRLVVGWISLVLSSVVCSPAMPGFSTTWLLWGSSPAPWSGPQSCPCDEPWVHRVAGLSLASVASLAVSPSLVVTSRGRGAPDSPPCLHAELGAEVL
jgi:hypothetical protein